MKGKITVTSLEREIEETLFNNNSEEFIILGVSCKFNAIINNKKINGTIKFKDNFPNGFKEAESMIEQLIKDEE